METARIRNERGQFVRGNPGKPRGAKDGPMSNRRRRKILASTGAEIVASAAEPFLKEVTETLARQAVAGDVSAASTLLRHASPAAQRTVVRGAEDLNDLPPDVRLAAIAVKAQGGELSLEAAQALAGLAKAEIEAQVIAPLRAAVAAVKTGQTVAEVMPRLFSALESLPVLSGEMEETKPIVVVPHGES